MSAKTFPIGGLDSAQSSGTSTASVQRSGFSLWLTAAGLLLVTLLF